MSIAHRHVNPGGFVGSLRPKSAIRSVLYHMAEGNDVSGYLSRQPARNVSVQYCVEADGEIVSMVPEARTAGSVNPATIRVTNDAYYGAEHARYVLGDLWQNPNVGVIAVEVAGHAKDGPSPVQVAAMVALFKDCRTRYPAIKPLGHRDLQQVKPCPGSTPAMKEAFALMGGHGLDYHREAPNVASVDYTPDRVTDVTAAAQLLETPGGKVIGTVTAPLTRLHLGFSPDGKYALIPAVIDGKSRTAWVGRLAVSPRKPAPAPAPDAVQLAAARKGGIKDAAAAAGAVV